MENNALQFISPTSAATQSSPPSFDPTASRRSKNQSLHSQIPPNTGGNTHTTLGPTNREVPEDGRPSSASVPARLLIGGEKQADAAGSEGGASAVRRGAAGSTGAEAAVNPGVNAISIAQRLTEQAQEAAHAHARPAAAWLQHLLMMVSSLSQVSASASSESEPGLTGLDGPLPVLNSSTSVIHSKILSLLDLKGKDVIHISHCALVSKQRPPYITIQPWLTPCLTKFSSAWLR